MANLQIITTDENGGGNACEALWYELAREALDAGHAVKAFVARRSLDHQALKELEGRGMELASRWAEPKSGRLIPLAYKIWQRTGAGRSGFRVLSPDADFVLLNVGTMIEAAREPWATILEGLKMPYGIIVHSNSEIRQYPRSAVVRLRGLLERARRVYFVSQRLQDNAEEQLLLRIPGARVIRNPVNLDSTKLEPWPSADGSLRLACVGRLDAFVKGQIRLLHALSADPWRTRDWRLSFYGSGPDEAIIREAAAFYRLEERVRWGGFVKDIRGEVWAKHHLLVMPSMLEGMPLTLVEAMVCGRPALCSDVGGAAELIRDGENGFLAGSPFARQLRAGLERVWERREALSAMGEQAHRDAVGFLPEYPGRELLHDVLSAAVEVSLAH